MVFYRVWVRVGKLIDLAKSIWDSLQISFYGKKSLRNPN